jgi:glycosyltransferase involved in cell wall biosynthesis
VLLVRDEVDIVRLCVLHHLAAGCERILVLDNGSSDGTQTVLRRLAARVPISWSSDPGEFRQDELVTGLAQEATRAGADWILPLDADEFWVAPGGLAAALDRPSQPGALKVERDHFIQRRDQRRSTPAGVLSMTMRVAAPSKAAEAVDEFTSGRRSMFEVKVGGKLAMRASPNLVVDRGAHTASGLPALAVEATDVIILHAPLRSRACFAGKADHGERLERAGWQGTQGWHVRHWAARLGEGALDAEWAAHSYDGDGTLLVGTRRVPLVRDDRLASTLRRWVRSPAKQLVARALGRTY